MINEGLMIMLTGMSVVFLFLMIIIVTMALTSKLVQVVMKNQTQNATYQNEYVAILCALAYHDQQKRKHKK